MYVSSCYYICVFILLSVLIRLYSVCVLVLLYMCLHTTRRWGLSMSGVLILLYMRLPAYVCPRATIYVSSYYCISVLILLYLCPHNTMYVSSYYYISVIILIYVCGSLLYMCVLILLLYVSSFH